MSWKNPPWIDAENLPYFMEIFYFKPLFVFITCGVMEKVLDNHLEVNKL